MREEPGTANILPSCRVDSALVILRSKHSSRLISVQLKVFSPISSGYKPQNRLLHGSLVLSASFTDLIDIKSENCNLWLIGVFLMMPVIAIKMEEIRIYVS